MHLKCNLILRKYINLMYTVDINKTQSKHLNSRELA